MSNLEVSFSELPQAAVEIQSALAKLPSLSAVIGFDAFIDESIRIVATRTSPESFEPIPTLGEYGAWVTASAGRSGLREFISDEIVAGGCAVNMGDGLASLGLALDAFLGAGDPPHPVFHDMISKCRSHHPTGIEPGRAIVTEFKDGKLMLCGFGHFADFTPAHLQNHLDSSDFAETCSRADGIALTSWSVYPYMTDCWQHIQSHTLSDLTHRPRFFFDLADPASRSPDDLVKMAVSLRGFESLGPVTLSVNGNEASQLARALGLDEPALTLENAPLLSEKLRDTLRISEVCIHLIRGAATADGTSCCFVQGPYTAHPRRSVGAGDRFNAGFFLGLLLGLSAGTRLFLGCASSGFFVRNAMSASSTDVLNFLDAWRDGRVAS
ncbi:MAG: hypothetical protein Fur0032_01570 [Terrimicrobiaceae bacterium]